MTPERLTQLNRILGDRMGLIPEGHVESGQPRFKWVRSEDLTFMGPSGERIRQCKRENTWVLAKWCEPPDFNVWRSLYKLTLGYPREGYWFMLQPLKPGVEPDEQFCSFCADQLDFQKSLDLRTTFNLIMDQEERTRRVEKAKSDELIESLIRYHVPGARGGSYSAPRTRFDR